MTALTLTFWLALGAVVRFAWTLASAIDKVLMLDEDLQGKKD